MKYYLLFILFCAGLLCSAQGRIVPTDRIIVSGDIQQSQVLALADLKKYPLSFVDSIPVYNHLMVRKSVLYKVAGVPLKRILSTMMITSPSPKELSRYYIVCVASDGYSVVFSWNELFNTATGDQVLLIIRHDGQDPERLNDRIALISPSDRASGRRYVKGLKKIIIKHI
ncbi:molybdopterin-binding protein [Niabella beijingensis]|uniref:molybdopterin-binding protein n=1 Tax=Niabella beijingensis TaxID=2872700 RepID=UPI001CC1B47A|nr:molybdopterin-binding protein [Niabella beijingensis]